MTTEPDVLVGVAGELQGIGSAVQAQSVATAGPTTAVVPCAGDVVSALTAVQFNAHAAQFQRVAAQAAVIHQMFVATLNGSADAYAAAEAANVFAAS